MAVITVPSIPAAGVQMRLLRADLGLEFFSGAEVIVETTKAIWLISFPLKPLKEVNAAAWRGALVQLSKLANTFLVQPPFWTGPGTGYAGTQPLVKGADQLGTSLVCDIVSTASTAISLAGDFLEVNGEFKCLTANATTASGASPNEVTFNFEPALRQAPADNLAVDILTPQLAVRLITPEAQWAVSVGDFHDLVINAVESFGP